MQQAKTQTRRRWWLWIVSALVIASVILISIMLTFDIRISINPTNQLEQALTRWQTANIDNYTLFVEVQAPFQTSGIYKLTVQDGELANTVVYNPPTFRFDPNAPAFDVPTSQGAPYMPEALFNRAARLKEDFGTLHIYAANTSRVNYNDEYGYVTELIDNTCGWLTLAEECITRVEVVRFEPHT